MLSFKICPQEFLFHLRCRAGGFISLSSLFSPTYLFMVLHCLLPLPIQTTRTILGMTLSKKTECDSRNPSSSSDWLTEITFMIFPHLVLAYVLFCPVRVLYSQTSCEPTFCNLCPRFLKSVRRCKMMHMEGRKILCVCLLVPKPMINALFNSVQVLSYHSFLLCILIACHLH